MDAQGRSGYVELSVGRYCMHSGRSRNSSKALEKCVTLASRVCNQLYLSTATAEDTLESLVAQLRADTESNPEDLCCIDYQMGVRLSPAEGTRFDISLEVLEHE
ncbi:hypothetical protein GF351_02265, partial [Candidatus Woesearchaeota archaeon]|nr:hypothetical protein [Candidatus Woesearchaeota archaeon]